MNLRTNSNEKGVLALMKDKNFKKSRTRLGWMVFLLLIWQGVAMSGVFPSALFPSVGMIGQALRESIVQGELVHQTGYSLILILQGLFWGLLLAIIAASLSIANKAVNGLTDTLTTLAHPLPGIALLPIIILWFGTGTLSILVIIVHSVIWPMFVNLMTGFRAIPRIYKEAGLNLGLNNWQIAKDIMLPASLPYLLSGMRIGWARAWRALISAEMIFGAVGSQGGIGWYIFKQRVFMDTPGMFAGLIVIVLIGILVEDYVFAVLEDRTVKRWGMI